MVSAARFGAGGDEEPAGGDGRPGRDDPLVLEIPDDARELDADVRAYRRELRRSRLRGRLRRLLFTRRWNRYGLSGPLVTAILILVALVASLAVLFAPRPQVPMQRAPLATRPSASPGAVGGLLPPVSLVVGERERPAHDLRPAVLALVPNPTPEQCRCASTLDALFRQAQEYGLPLVLVGGPGERRTVRRLAAQVGNGTARVAEDRGLALTSAYRPQGVSAVLVRSDGVVTHVHRGLTPGMRLEFDLAQLSRPATGSAR